jgi:hypothetical protein
MQRSAVMDWATQAISWRWPSPENPHPNRRDFRAAKEEDFKK